MSFSVIHKILKENEFQHFGWTELTRPLTFDVYSKWLGDNKHGEMSYLQSTLEAREYPQSFWQARSAIVVLQPYTPHPEPAESIPKSLPIARYAQGFDYHDWFLKKLDLATHLLAKEFPQEFFFPITDSMPIMERDLAYRAGLGWIGKNTCLIREDEGSFFFIGEILTSLQANEFLNVAVDRCGTCTRCIDACPTGALEEPRTLNATLCISYWNIEAKALAPEPLRTKVASQFFGCDICQEVCPWNKSVIKAESEKTPSDAEKIKELKWILESSNRGIEKEFWNTPLLRARPIGLKRNALYQIAHHGLKDLTDVVEKYLNHESLGELARWVLEKINPQSAGGYSRDLPQLTEQRHF